MAKYAYAPLSVVRCCNIISVYMRCSVHRCRMLPSRLFPLPLHKSASSDLRVFHPSFPLPSHRTRIAVVPVPTAHTAVTMPRIRTTIPVTIPTTWSRSGCPCALEFVSCWPLSMC